MKSYKYRHLSNTIQSFFDLSKKYTVEIQLVPSHCDLLGNEKAENLQSWELYKNNQIPLPALLKKKRFLKEG